MRALNNKKTFPKQLNLKTITMSINPSTITNSYSSHKKHIMGLNCLKDSGARELKRKKNTFMSVTEVNNQKFWATYSGYPINMAIPNPIYSGNTSGGQATEKIIKFLHFTGIYLIAFRNMLPICCCSSVCTSFNRKH